jgi:hypothetical protein
MKFVITRWIDEFDEFDGLTNHFSILGEFYDLAEARAYLSDNVNRLTAEQLSQHAGRTGWHLMSIQGQDLRPLDYREKGINKNNKVVDHRSFKIGDGTGFNSAYNYLELIELPKDAGVDKNLFNLEHWHCEFAVRQFFEGPDY